MNKIKSIDIIGAMLDGGASKRGCRLAPTALRIAGLIFKITKLGICVKDCGDIVDDDDNTFIKNESYPQLNNLEEVNRINSKLYNKVCNSFKGGSFPLVLGGDHSVSIGSISAAQEYYKDIGVIWVDAHGDFNNAESSPSGNIHGMPLSVLCGLGPHQTLPFVNQGHQFTKIKNAVILGGREFDKTEKVRIKDCGLTVLPMSYIDKVGIYAAANKAIEIAAMGTKGIYLSFDLDSLDPSEAPGVGTSSGGGLTFREARMLCEILAKSELIVGMDFVELNPLFDVSNKTVNLTVQLILAALGKELV